MIGRYLRTKLKDDSEQQNWTILTDTAWMEVVITFLEAKEWLLEPSAADKVWTFGMLIRFTTKNKTSQRLQKISFTAQIDENARASTPSLKHNRSNKGLNISAKPLLWSGNSTHGGRILHRTPTAHTSRTGCHNSGTSTWVGWSTAAWPHTHVKHCETIFVESLLNLRDHCLKTAAGRSEYALNVASQCESEIHEMRRWAGCLL